MKLVSISVKVAEFTNKHTLNMMEISYDDTSIKPWHIQRNEFEISLLIFQIFLHMIYSTQLPKQTK
jgi:hypothetical protein